LKEKREAASEKEMEGCTFNPAINKNSERAAQIGRRDNRKVQERLYDERIMLAAKAKQRQAQKMAEDDSHFKQDCTFRPAGEVKAPPSSVKKNGKQVRTRVTVFYHRIVGDIKMSRITFTRSSVRRN